MENEKDYNVVLPCKPNDFVSFLSSLLGKNQTIKKIYEGEFLVRKEDVENVYLLIDQRVSQQNSAGRLNVSITTFFSDNSSIEFNNIDDFMNHRELKKVTTDIVRLVMTYLIQFNDKKLPEKQEIEINFVSKRYRSGNYDVYSGFKEGGIEIKILHTARTWANDIEMLLTTNFDSIVKKQSKIKWTIINIHGKLAACFGILMFIVFVCFGFFIGNKIIKNHLTVNVQIAKNLLTLDQKVDNIQSLMNSNFGGQYYFVSTLFLVCTGIISYKFSDSLSINYSVFYPKPGYLITTEYDIKEYALAKKKEKKETIKYILNIILGIFLSVFSNWLYYIITEKVFKL